MSLRYLRPGLLASVLLSARAVLGAADITFSGQISYSGTYDADTLCVAVIDTTGDFRVVTIVPHHVDAVPFQIPYSVTFDNAGVGPWVVLGVILDTDLSGCGSLDTPGDIVGWYGSAPEPVFISSAQSQSGLDFSLPTAEIHGSVELYPGFDQVDVIIYSEQGPSGFSSRLVHKATSSGPFEVHGVYAGTWFVSGFACCNGIPEARRVLCYRDNWGCSGPTPIPLVDGQVVTGIDLNFNIPTAVQGSSWGRIKRLYR